MVKDDRELLMFCDMLYIGNCYINRGEILVEFVFIEFFSEICRFNNFILQRLSVSSQSYISKIFLFSAWIQIFRFLECKILRYSSFQVPRALN